MAEANMAELQRRYGGQHIARVDDKVIASATTYRELSEQIDRMGVAWSDLVIEFVDSVTSVSVFSVYRAPASSSVQAVSFSVPARSVPQGR